MPLYMFGAMLVFSSHFAAKLILDEKYEDWTGIERDTERPPLRSNPPERPAQQYKEETTAIPDRGTAALRRIKRCHICREDRMPQQTLQDANRPRHLVYTGNGGAWLS